MVWKRRPNAGFSLARGWIQAVILVFLFGFFVLGFLAYRTYTGEPPIPGKVVDPDGRLLFTRANIMAGQGTFLRNGLMDYGSIFGHGAYLGPGLHGRLPTSRCSDVDRLL